MIPPPKLQPPQMEAADTAGKAPEAASVIVLRKDAVLMVRRGRPPLGGLWSFPGGKLEQGETAAGAAIRELREETALVVDRVVPLGRFRPAPDRSPVVLTVHAAAAPEGDPVAGDDAAAAEYVPFGRVLLRPVTPRAAHWVAAAILALKTQTLFEAPARTC